MSEQEKVKGVEPSERDLSWLRHAESEVRAAPARLEETAKFLVGIISIAFTIFISSRPAELISWFRDTRLFAVVVLWFLAIVFCFLVVFPWRYHFNPDDPASIERTYRDIARYKYIMLVVSVCLFLVALGLVVFVA